MKTKLAHLLYDLGPLGVAALVLLAAAAVFHQAVLGPLKLRADALEARPVPRASAAASDNAADKVAAVYQFLRSDEPTTDWLAKLHGIGAATGVKLESAAYRTEHAEGRIVRYEIVMPVAGSYAQIRDFLARALAEIPAMSVDQVSLKRADRQQGALRAELRVSLHKVKS